MAMNNIYYRFIHLVDDLEFSKMPAKLRMNIIGNPGIDLIDFEMSCLAVSAMNGCGLCMSSHTTALLKAGVSKEGVQTTIRIASIISAVSVGIVIGGK